jgi:signal transduction histidine kinase/phage shock protein PspC (stress-responsive transcriptional regulator)
MWPDAARRDHRLVAITTRSLTRADFARPTEGRMVAGVAVGLADTFGLDPNVVRGAFVVLSVASGLGLIVYGIAWAAMPPGGARNIRRRETDVIANIALGMVVLGGLLTMRAFGFWPGDLIVWPLAAALLGLALLATRSSSAASAARAELPDWPLLRRLPPESADAVAVLFGTRRGTLARVIAGAVCVAAGVTALVLTVGSWRAVRGAIVGAIAVLIGVAIVIGPGLSRLARAFLDERQERIRADERADMAAHLHDSVLQTLALVQRRADDPREVVRLARLQERELREYLLRGETATAGTADSLGAALEEVAATVETEHGVPIEVVRVRDCPIDGMEPLVLASREAMVNAARHSGAASVAVYVEVEPDHATVFVRDRGRGFDRAEVPDDRGGISNSIVGRMQRASGAAKVRSTVGEGTEIELSLPRGPANGNGTSS